MSCNSPSICGGRNGRGCGATISETAAPWRLWTCPAMPGAFSTGLRCVIFPSFMPPHGPRNATTLTNLLATIGSGTVLVALGEGPWNVDRGVSIPSNVTLCVLSGCPLTGSGTVRFDGSYLTDSTHPCFSTNVVLSGLRQYVRPEWWGFCETNAAVANRAALQRAMSAADGQAVLLPAGAYAIGASSFCITNVTVQGQRTTVHDLATGRPADGTRLLGSLSIRGHAYGVSGLSVMFGAESADPLMAVGGTDSHVSHVSLFGSTNAATNAHNIFFSGTNSVAQSISSYNCWGHGFVSKSVGLTAENVTVHNCQFGVTLRSGADGDLRVVSNDVRHVRVTADGWTNHYGLVVTASYGKDVEHVTVQDFRADGLYMGADIEASNGSVMENVTIDDAHISACTYGVRSYMSSPAVMTNVFVRGAQVQQCAVGYYQQAVGTWIDVVESIAVNCDTPVIGNFRTTDITVLP